MTKSLLSKEQFDSFFLPTTNFTNGAIVKSYTFNRNNFRNTIYAKFDFYKTNLNPSGAIKPYCFRGYYDDLGNLQYEKFEGSIISNEGANLEVLFIYRSTEQRNYINYRVELECVGDLDSVFISEVGLVFQQEEDNKGIILTSNRKISYKGSNRQDINENFSSYQTYSKGYGFSFLTNRQNIDRVVNVFESPFRLVDIKTNCIDNSTRELSLQDIKLEYPTGATQYVLIKVSCVEEI